MRLLKILVVFFIGFYFVGADLCAALSGQEVDLVEMQKKEKERRKKLKETKKETKHVFTDDDLKKMKDEKFNLTEDKQDSTTQTNSTDSTNNTAADSTQEVIPPEEDTREKTTSTNDSMGEKTTGIQAREKISLDPGTGAEGAQSGNMSEEDHWRSQRRKMDAQVEEVEEALRQEEERFKQLRNNMFIYPPDLLDDQLKLKKEMEESEKRLEEYKDLLKQAKDLREQFYDDARKQGIPPGWLRD